MLSPPVSAFGRGSIYSTSVTTHDIAQTLKHHEEVNTEAVRIYCRDSVLYNT